MIVGEIKFREKSQLANSVWDALSNAVSINYKDCKPLRRKNDNILTLLQKESVLIKPSQPRHSVSIATNI